MVYGNRGTLDHKTGVQSEQKCCTLCAAEPGCAVATYLPAREQCWFKGEQPLTDGSAAAADSALPTRVLKSAVSCVLQSLSSVEGRWVAGVLPEGQGSEEARAHRRFMAEHPVPITFVVLQIPDSPTCGGCVALATLADALQALGEAVARPRLDRFDTASSPVAPGKITVAVFPEAYDARALRKRLPGALAVRWMLAPVPEPGTRNWPNGYGAEEIDPRFAQDEWVWNYGIYGTPGMTGGVHGVPHSNLLIAQTNPTPGDDLDLTGYPALPRHGTVFTYRKGKAWHGADLQLLHKPGDTEMMRSDSRADVITMLRSHEYFVCYDPFSYLAFMAAQLGCIPVIHPMRGHSKFEWLNATLFSGYMRDNKLTNLQGVAYGWGDVEFARKTLGRARAEQYRVKAWGLGTVARFARDARRWAAGQRSGFEGAKNTSDFYPTGWITRHLENKRKNNNGTTRALVGAKTSSGAPSPATNNNSWVAPTVFLHFHEAGGTSACALYRAAGQCTLYPASTLLLIFLAGQIRRLNTRVFLCSQRLKSCGLLAEVEVLWLP